MTPFERLVYAWTKAGYPRSYAPRQQFEQVAELVKQAYEVGTEDFIKTGWLKANVDYPFAPSHPRYQAMIEAYREAAEGPWASLEEALATLPPEVPIKDLPPKDPEAKEGSATDAPAQGEARKPTVRSRRK